MPGGTRTQIGIMTFDTTIHFYRLDSQVRLFWLFQSVAPNNQITFVFQTGQSSMLVVSNLTDVFVPLPDGVLVNLEECSGVGCLMNLIIDVCWSLFSSQFSDISLSSSSLLINIHGLLGHVSFDTYFFWDISLLLNSLKS